MAKIENGKTKIGGHEIVVKNVLSWMKSLGRYCTSVEMRDKFGWKLRQTGRVLMRLLEVEGKVVIMPHPSRKRSYCYGLPKTLKPTVETFKPKETEKPEVSFEKPQKQRVKTKITSLETCTH